jgi:DNA helicase HerA-like ATPase
MLAYLGENAERIGREVGNVAPASIASIQRAILQLEQQGGQAFFGEPALRLEDMMRTGLDGRGQVNVLDATKLMASPRLYAAFLLWLLSELFEQLPEVGDPTNPASSSSSTRPICCSTTRPTLCAKRSNRSCA